MFGTCLVAYFLNFFFFVFWLEETRGAGAAPQYTYLSTDIPSQVRARGFFNRNHFLDVWRVCFKSREYCMRGVLLTLILTMTLNFTAFSK